MRPANLHLKANNQRLSPDGYCFVPDRDDQSDLASRHELERSGRESPVTTESFMQPDMGRVLSPVCARRADRQASSGPMPGGTAPGLSYRGVIILLPSWGKVGGRLPPPTSRSGGLPDLFDQVVDGLLHGIHPTDNEDVVPDSLIDQLRGSRRDLLVRGIHGQADDGEELATA